MAISDRFGDAADAAKEKLGEKEERDRLIDRAGDAVDAQPDGKIADKVDRAQPAARKGGDRAQNRKNNRSNNNR
ncbi:Rv0909 family putative TA system antitoxin [Asanoa sp. NPDC050611]|uniref:Rv0909 family putative TA system antitoxin n=1 Tax=Asanoa sp. NPDC050611 TaxID=3157098 RepID=UPI0033FB7AB9